MGVGGWILKHPSRGYLMIPVSPSPVWNREMGDRSYNRRGISGSVEAFAETIYKKKRRGGGEVGRGKWGERGQVREAV